MTDLPTDFDQVVQLVESLYQVGADPERIKATQSTLQKLQFLPNAFEIADLLFSQESPNCQFFGALTYAVRINSIKPNELGPEIHLVNLLRWLVHLRNKRQSMFVVQKILSTLSTYFARFCRDWQSPVMTVLSVLVQNNAIGQWKSDNKEEQEYVISSASPDDVLLTLKFCQILIEDLYTDNITHKESAYVIDTLRKHNLFAFCNLINRAFHWIHSGEVLATALPLSQAITSFSAWVQNLCGTKTVTDAEAKLQTCYDPLLEFLFSPDESVSEKSFNCVIDTIKSSPWFWRLKRPEIMDILLSFGERAKSAYFLLDESSPDWERSQLMVKLFIAFCQEYMQKYADANGLDPKYEQLLHFLTIFTQGNPTIHMVDEPLAADFLSFWTELAEFFISQLIARQDSIKFQNILVGIIDIYCEKIKLPSQETAITWDSEEFAQLDNYRLEFCDLLETVQADDQSNVLGHVTNMTVNAIASGTLPSGEHDYTLMDWTSIEASLYCLASLISITEPDDNVDANLEMIFSSSIWKDLFHCNISRVRRTAVNFLGSADTFLERARGQAYIIPVVEYLFSSLQAEDLVLTASRSIQKLCTACGNHLIGFLPQFFNIYESLSLFSSLENTAHERIISGVVRVIQDAASEDEQIAYIDRLVSIVIDQCKTAFDNGLQIVKETAVIDTTVMDRVISLLKCLTYLVKGLKNVFFDQDNENGRKTRAKIQEITNKITEVVKVFSVEQEPFNKNQEICEKCCEILKCGFPEKYSSNAIFDIGKVLLFIQNAYKIDPVLRCLILADLACAVLTTMDSNSAYSDHVNAFINEIFDLYFSENSLALLHESEVQVADLKLMSYIVLNNHMDNLFNRPELDALFNLAQGTLSTPADRLALRESASFWCSFIARVPPNHMENSKYQLILKVGPSLTELLLNKVSGEGLRSDLETYTKVLRKLISKYPQETKEWLNGSVMNGSETDSKGKREFILKLLMLRGSPDTLRIVKDFWLSCRRIENYDGYV